MSEAETVEEDQGSEDDEGGPDIIKKTNLRQLLRDETDSVPHKASPVSVI